MYVARISADLDADAVHALTRGEQVDQEARRARLRTAVTEVAWKQRELGIDIVNDGEFGKATSGSVDYGAWQSYAYERLTGWEAEPSPEALQRTDVDQGRAVPRGGQALRVR